MAQQPIRFADGTAYQRAMGVWSEIAGHVFLDWLAPDPGQRWIDVGCGNGAFTSLLIQRHAPAEVQGIDPSEGQLTYARTRGDVDGAMFQLGDAMALPFDAGRFDAAVMALVIFFVPDPARGVAEMVRVVRPGGLVSAYAWDVFGGGFPFEPIQAELRAMGLSPLQPPTAEASRVDVMRGLWDGAGLDAIETRDISVERTFVDFDDFWSASTGMGLKQTLAQWVPADVETLKERVRVRIGAAATGPVVWRAWANAIKGRVPN